MKVSIIIVIALSSVKARPGLLGPSMHTASSYYPSVMSESKYTPPVHDPPYSQHSASSDSGYEEIMKSPMHFSVHSSNSQETASRSDSVSSLLSSAYGTSALSPFSSFAVAVPSTGHGTDSGGYSDEESTQYEFMYEVLDQASGSDFGHSETRDEEVTRGRYYVLLPDGRKQVVTYTVDQNGYHPEISYERSDSQGPY